MFWLLLILRALICAPIDFKADFYKRDLQANTLSGRGNAYLKSQDKELWADEIEVDFANQMAEAKGHVKLKERSFEIYAEKITHALTKNEATLTNGYLIYNQLVVRGETIRQINAKTFELENGYFTNCNNDLLAPPQVEQCNFDWKISGSKVFVTLDKYAHFNNAILSAKGVPVFYVPYFFVPVKTKRESGLLFPKFIYSDNLGNGIGLPIFLALSDWQDLTLEPFYHFETGFYLGTYYRYRYSANTLGNLNLFFTERRFSDDKRNPTSPLNHSGRYFSLVGEGAVDFQNQIQLSESTTTRQVIRLISNPYYTVDYGTDVAAGIDTVSLRSLISLVTLHGPNLWFSKLELHQPLLVTKDGGVDKGPVIQAPSVGWSTYIPNFLTQHLTFENDAIFTNYARTGWDYDPVPNPLDRNAAENIDQNPDYHEGDYIRTGRRLWLEPKLYGQFPLARGFDFQPLLKTGAFLYHFDYPTPSFFPRYYLQYEIPFSLYLSRTFKSDVSGFESIQHVFQPRISYLGQPLITSDNHPFFFSNNSQGLTNPRFDDYDFLFPYEIVKFELINRFRKKDASSQKIDRFVFFKVTEELNLTILSSDPRYSKKWKPLDFLGEFYFRRFTGQIQGNVSWEYQYRPTGEAIREMDLSASLKYGFLTYDYVGVGNRLSLRADETFTEKTLFFSFLKSTPWILDLEGMFEYSYKRGEFLGSKINMHFFSKPRYCWGLTVSLGQNDLKQKFVRFLLNFSFGDTRPSPFNP